MSETCIKKVADSIYTSKIRYGLQLCAAVRMSEEEKKDGLMKVMQTTQNKMLRFLNKTRVSDKINTKSILNKFNMVSVNQLMAQIKLTETWKALNMNYENNTGIDALQITHVEGQGELRSAFSGNLIESRGSSKAKKTLINDSANVWKKAPLQIKSCKTLSSAKREIKAFVKTLPI